MNNTDNKKVKGAKILTLYKQHYLEEYAVPLESEYSCWGYFDGMDITDVMQGESALFEKKSRAAISDIWYQTAKKIKEQKGRFSQQNIGVLRCEEGQDDHREWLFWDKSTRKIFLSVCFVQLRDKTHASELRKKWEEISDKVVQILTYVTFDNADLVVFFQSNSFAQIAKRIQMIDTDSNVAYVHPISGVQEKTLGNAALKKNYSFLDSAGNGLVNDPVQEIRISLVGNAGSFEKKLKYLLDDAERSASGESEKLKLSFGTYAYMTGHENYIYSFRNTDMRTLLALLIPGGVLTHKNGLFGKQIYNIETQIVFEEKKLDACPAEEFEKEKLSEKTSWCRHELVQYKTYMEMAEKMDDDGLYSYCSTIIQTLNTLAQFENFQMSRNIFYIIYPAFKLFSKQISEVKGVFSEAFNEKRKKVMNAIMDFLDSVNSIVYHAIHTDQIFLMVPGYSGTSFSIPTKLSLFYLWYLESVSRILNDSENQYSFYLTPVMESKPHTYLADFGLPPEDRLICVKVSQRSLYMPRALLIILAHETAHYVGHSVRKRVLRCECVKKTISGIIVSALIPYWYIEECNECYGKKYKDYLEDKMKESYDYIEEEIQNILDFCYEESKENNQDAESIFHVSKINEILKNACAEILADENSKLKSIIYGKVEEFQKYAKSFDEQIEFSEILEKITDNCEKRRLQLLGSGECDQIIDELLREYQEIFADIAAESILKFEPDDYAMAFNISEGYKVKENHISKKSYRRYHLGRKMRMKNGMNWKESGIS